MLIVDKMNKPKAIVRSENELQALSRETRGMALYYHQLSPACIKTRRIIEELNLPIEYRDIRTCQVHRDDLLSGVGEFKVPCLKTVVDGKAAWMDDHGSICAFLMEKFGIQENQSRS